MMRMMRMRMMINGGVDDGDDNDKDDKDDEKRKRTLSNILKASISESKLMSSDCCLLIICKLRCWW